MFQEGAIFARLKKSGQYGYLSMVENRKVGGKVIQRIIATIDPMDQLHAKSQEETLIRSLSRYSEKVLVILSGEADVSAAKKICAAMVFERLWKELGIQKVINELLRGRKFGFDVERAIFLTVPHRLFASGLDPLCDKWRRDYVIEGVVGLSLHHLPCILEPDEDLSYQ